MRKATVAALSTQNDGETSYFKSNRVRRALAIDLAMFVGLLEDREIALGAAAAARLQVSALGSACTGFSHMSTWLTVSSEKALPCWVERMKSDCE
jgi:hypothetical protein